MMPHHALLLALMAAAAPIAAGIRTGIEMRHPWAQVVGPGQDAIAVYGTLVSAAGDVLTGIASPAAAHAGYYIRLGKAGQISLTRVDDGLRLAPGQLNLMSPEGSQIRLTGLTRAFVAGDSFVLSLVFARAGVIDVTVRVELPTATQPSH